MKLSVADLVSRWKRLTRFVDHHSIQTFLNQSFRGLRNKFRRSVPNFALIPSLLKQFWKRTSFSPWRTEGDGNWGARSTAASVAVTSDPSTTKTERTFLPDINTWNKRFRGQLSLKQPKRPEKLSGYWSWSINKAVQTYHPMQTHGFAVTWAFQPLRMYLEEWRLTIQTNYDVHR